MSQVKLPKGITQRKDGTYMARYSFEGARKYIYGKELKEVEKKLRNALYEVEHGIHSRPEKIVLNSWFDTWIKEYKGESIKPETLKLYNHAYQTYIKPHVGSKKLKDIRPEHMQKVFNKMVRENYSSSTIDLARIMIAGCLRQAVKNDILLKNPMDSVTITKKRKKTETAALTRDQQNEFLKELKGTYMEAFYATAFSTGMRIGELAGLTWDCVDFKKKIIKVEKTLNHRSTKDYTYGTPKTERSNRVVPLLPQIAKLLKQYRKLQLEKSLQHGEDWYVASKKCKKEFGNLVFTNERGKPMNQYYARMYTKKYVTKINKRKKEDFIEPFYPHTMRHAFATRAIENGMDYNTLKEILGHSSLSMTMDLYAHVLPDTKNEQIQKIAHLF